MIDSSDYFDRQLCCSCTTTDCPEHFNYDQQLGKCIGEFDSLLFHYCYGNGDDEMECPIPICKYDEHMFPCRDSRKCIFRSQLCDGFADCYEHSDELYCADLALPWKH
ncbi:unnamed protein product [Onchocerca flexuosa]|nr:unnamed protein product [Onchocerca flexuosa]